MLAEGKTAVGKADTTHLKLGMTKWTKQLSRTIDVPSLILALKDDGVITPVEKLDIEKEYNRDEQSGKLIMMMVDQTNENIWKFCRCLRRFDENLANLVENQNTDGIDIERNIQQLEESRIRKVLNKHIVKNEEDSIQSEQIHILVERELGHTVDFKTILQIATDIFSLDKTKCKYPNLQGMSWNESELNLVYRSHFENVKDEIETGQKNIMEMSAEEFIKYIEDQFNKVKGGFGAHMKKAFEDECIVPETLFDLTDSEFEILEKRYMPGKVMPMGIRTKLKAIQKQIKLESARQTTDAKIKLRDLDSSKKTTYNYGIVKPPEGNLLIPAHAFRTLPIDLPLPYIVKECIQFIAACINSRKNGTIHFGIQTKGQGCGLITGVRRPSAESLELLDYEIQKSIESCFESEQVSCVKRCVRPIQVVGLFEDDNATVIELDIVPHCEYTKQAVFRAFFPPKGIQEKKLFVLRDKLPFDVVSVQYAEESQVVDLYSCKFKERSLLDEKTTTIEEHKKSLAVKLAETLTSGSNYVTDQYIPIVCTGKITGTEHEKEIREYFDVPEAFLSSPAVFDFDPATDLRKHVENEDTVFRVLTTENNIMTRDSNVLTTADRMWMYCNGNYDLNIPEMTTQEWYRRRYHIVKDVIEVCRQKAPRRRAMVIFLAYGKFNGKDPLLEIAEECFKSQYKDNCRVIVIAKSDEIVSDLKSSLTDIIPSSAIEDSIHTGMEWGEISETLKTVFQTSSSHGCKLPKSDGHFVTMSAEEKRILNFTDIDILSGEECVEEDKMFDDKQREEWKEKEQHKFYRGEDVSWWNFYYADQVQDRDVHSKYMKTARDKIKKERDAKFETLHVYHQPGAGGSTSGKYLLWNLSQFKEGPEYAFRCCVVKHVTEDTASQIASFMFFKEKDPKHFREKDTYIPNPVVILTDNESEENLCLLESTLNFQAYHKGHPKKLFCLHIAVSRKPVAFTEADGFREPILKHELSPRERNWFRTKFKELEQRNIDVNTLISFNVMRNNFDKEYIGKLAERMLESVGKSEKEILKCLAMIDMFDRDNCVPVSTFDFLMNPGPQINADGSIDVTSYIDKGPIGLVIPIIKKHHLSNECRIWNVDITDALSLLIKQVSDKTILNGIKIISQALSDAILNQIMKEESLTLHDVTNFVLNIVSKHVKERNMDSKHFVEIVNSLFKTRQVLTDEGEIKSQFSKLVQSLKAELYDEDEVSVNKKVARLMKKCFHTTDDAMVGQQLARFLYIHMNDFDGAEHEIKEAIHLQPQNSYLLDTHGQIYRAKLEKEIHKKGDIISDDDACEIIKIAFTAIEKFVEGQEFAFQEREGDMNDSCFCMEVKTAIYLLDNFKRFECYQRNPDLFLEYLNDPTFEVKGTPLEDIEAKCQINRLKKQDSFQSHIADSLRQVEERNYQVRRRLYNVYTDDNEKLLLRLREDFERFYGNIEERSKLQFQYGVGLKPLMQAYSKDYDKLSRRVSEADANLQKAFQEDRQQRWVDKRDLLVFLGYELIQMSDTNNEIAMTREKYSLLLRYCQTLLDIERKSSRPYLEAYLFFTILQWPTIPRMETESLCSPAAYNNVLKEWEQQFHKNFRTGSSERGKQNKAKNYFALGQGTIGCDVVDLECIRKEWMDVKTQTEGRKRKRKPVYGDHFWKEQFVSRRLQRLTGYADETGTAIKYEIKYKYWDYKFSIKTYYPNPHLSNRRVTFVLGFSWANLRAFDVEDDEKSSGNGHSKKKAKAKDNKAHGNGSHSGFTKGTTHTRERKNGMGDLQLEGAVGGEIPDTEEIQSTSSESDDNANKKDDDSAALSLHPVSNDSSTEKLDTEKKEEAQSLDVRPKQAPIPVVEAEGTDLPHEGQRKSVKSHQKKQSTAKKTPVELLNDRIKNLTYEEQKQNANGEFVFKVTIEDSTYEGAGHSKKQAKQNYRQKSITRSFWRTWVGICFFWRTYDQYKKEEE